MAICVCKCLNITLESEKVEANTDNHKLDLLDAEQRDVFFSKQWIVSCGTVRSAIAQPALVGQRVVGRCTLHSCLACEFTTHAIMNDQPNTVLIAKETVTTLDRINNLKKSTNFSPVFNLLVPEVTGVYDMNMKENINSNNILANNTSWPSAQQAIGSLNKQLRQTLQNKLEAVEESVRQFRDQKYAEFEAYKEKAQRDHNILASIISKARGNIDNDGWRMDTSVDDGPNSPPLPPLQRRRLSSIKDAKKITHIKHTQKVLPPEEDSLDAEDIFDLEGDSRHDMGSDQDDYDSDNSASRDEGIHIGRARVVNNNAADIARSLPINMPKFPIERPQQHHNLDQEEETHDIAASIKALAKSVHGDVFDLPRPRFSTQI